MNKKSNNKENGSSEDDDSSMDSESPEGIKINDFVLVKVANFPVWPARVSEILNINPIGYKVLFFEIQNSAIVHRQNLVKFDPDVHFPPVRESNTQLLVAYQKVVAAYCRFRYLELNYPELIPEFGRIGCPGLTDHIARPKK